LRDARDGLRDGLGIHLGLELDVFHPQLRIGAALVEHQHLAGIDPVRVLDLFLVHPPELGPAMGLLEELAGNAPERVAGNDDVAIRRIVGQLKRLGILGDGTGG
jgi:hypothetical protein